MAQTTAKTKEIKIPGPDHPIYIHPAEGNRDDLRGRNHRR